MKSPTRTALALGWFMALVAPAATLHVSQESPSPTPPYADWATAARTIQEAVDATQAGDTVLVTNGVYAVGGRAVVGTMTNRVAIDRAIRVQSVNGPATTVIQGGGAIRCAYVGDGVVLSGFTLTNGHTLSAGDYAREQSGGGAWCEASGVVTNCIFRGNGAGGDGGGAFQGTLIACTFSDNGAQNGGGAAESKLHECTLTRNSCDGKGGGAFDSLLYNCVLTGNFSDGWGGGASESTLYNCTLVGNRVEDFDLGGGGAYNCILFNCIATFNGEGGDVAYSTVFYTWVSAHGDPMFVDLAAGNYRLRPGSPCIDAGTGLSLVTGDLDGVRRPLDGNGDCRVAFDMGAYEYQPPSNPGERVRLTLRGSWPNIGEARGEAYDIQVVGNYAYLADGSNGLAAIDVSNPTEPDDDYDSLPARAFARALHVVGNYAYLADGASFRVISLANPMNPVLVGELMIAAPAFGEWLTDVYVVGNHAYVGLRVPEDDPPPSVQVVDVSTPTNPVVVSFFPLFLSVESIYVVGSYAYVLGDEPGFHIFDVSKPAVPVRVGFHATWFGWDVQVVSTNVYIADGDGRFAVFDVSDPARPMLVGNASTGGESLGVHVVGGYAYVADGDAGVTVLDVSNPASPLRVGGYDTCGRARRVQVAGNHAYVADGTSGLLVFEISGPPRFTSVSRAGDRLVLTWNGAPGLKLQRTASLANPNWIEVPGSDGQSRLELPLGSGSGFFRLAQPFRPYAQATSGRPSGEISAAMH